jgi:hypothetical protein
LVAGLKSGLPNPEENMLIPETSGYLSPLAEPHPVGRVQDTQLLHAVISRSSLACKLNDVERQYPAIRNGKFQIELETPYVSA